MEEWRGGCWPLAHLERIENGGEVPFGKKNGLTEHLY